MKKLFLGLTFLLASFNGTADVKATTTAEEFACSNWVEVDPGCSNHFWLCTDMYESADELIDDAIYFSGGRC